MASPRARLVRELHPIRTREGGNRLEFNIHRHRCPCLAAPEDENLGIGANLAYGLQHVLTMYGGIVAVPLIVGQAAGLAPEEVGMLITASLFAGGLATILQTLGLPLFGCRLPLVQGVSFAGVATMVAIVVSPTGGPTVIRAELPCAW